MRRKKIFWVLLLLLAIKTASVYAATHSTSIVSIRLIATHSVPGTPPDKKSDKLNIAGIKAEIPQGRHCILHVKIEYRYYSEALGGGKVEVRFGGKRGPLIWSDEWTLDSDVETGSLVFKFNYSGISELIYDYIYVYVRAEILDHTVVGASATTDVTVSAWLVYPDLVDISVASGCGSVFPSGLLEVWGDYIDVTAVPCGGYVFSGWSVSGGVSVVDGDDSGRFSVYGDGSITADFTENVSHVVYVLEVKSTPISVTVDYSGDFTGSSSTPFGLTSDGEFTVTLNAPSTVGNYTFQYWVTPSGNHTSEALTLSVDENMTVTAVYEAEEDNGGGGDGDGGNGNGSSKYVLHVRSNPVKGVMINYTGDLSGSNYTDFDIVYGKAFTVTLRAPSQVSSGGRTYLFDYWEVGGKIYYSSSVTVRVSGEKWATAYYEELGDSIYVRVYPPYINESSGCYFLWRTSGMPGWARSRYPRRIRFSQGGLYKFKTLASVVYNYTKYYFKYWLKDGKILTESWETPWINEPCTLTAVYSKKEDVTTYVKIDNVSVIVYPCNWTGSSDMYGEPNRLLRLEWFCAVVTVEASVYNKTGGSGGLVPAELNLTVYDDTWFTFSFDWNRSCWIDYNYTRRFTVNGSGVFNLTIPVEHLWCWKSLQVGLWTFRVNYAWDNTDEFGEGVAEVEVMVADASGPGNGTYVNLYWLPIDGDYGYVVAVPYWPDGLPIMYRGWFTWPFVESKLYCSLGRWSLYLEAGRWSDINGNFTIYAGTKIWSNYLSSLNDSTAVFYSKVFVYSLDFPALSTTAKLTFKSYGWLPNSTIYIAELATPVYALNWSDTRVWGRLKIIDWAKVEPVEEGWIIIQVKNLKTGEVREEWFYGDPYADFSVNVPSKYEVWSIVID